MDNTLFSNLAENPEEDLIDPTNDPNLEEDFPGDGGDNEYEFATGDLGNFMHTFEKGKENMGIEQMPTAEEFVDAGKQTLPPNVARKTGKFVTQMVDSTMAMGLSFISGEEVATHKATPEQFKELEGIICEYVKKTGGEIPLWLQLLISMLVIYALQVPGALKLRKEKNGRKTS